LEVSVKERVARPILSIQDAERIERNLLEKRGRGGFLGKGKIIETLRSVALQYFPYYEADVQATVNEIEKTGLMSTRTVQKIVSVRVGFDASSGDVIVVDGNGVVTVYPFLKNLSEEEVKVFRLMRDNQNNPQRLMGFYFENPTNFLFQLTFVFSNVSFRPNHFQFWRLFKLFDNHTCRPNHDPTSKNI